jgi:hypothetical protein
MRAFINKQTVVNLFMIIIRLARPADASSILNIYIPYIVNSAITFETEVPSTEAFAQRIITYQENWPWLVYEMKELLQVMRMLPNTGKEQPINGVLKARFMLIMITSKEVLPKLCTQLWLRYCSTRGTGMFMQVLHCPTIKVLRFIKDLVLHGLLIIKILAIN